MEVNDISSKGPETDPAAFPRAVVDTKIFVADLPSVVGRGERTRTIRSIPAVAYPSLTFERQGQFSYGLHQNSGSFPLDSRGPLPLENFLYQGNERSHDINGEPVGSASVARLYQDVTPYSFDPLRDLPHPDGRVRRADAGQEFVVFGESCWLESGSIRNKETTPASATIKCTASNTFVYRGAPGTDGEVYLVLYGITPSWIQAASFGPTGTFNFYIVNTTSGKQLVARNYATMGIPAGRFAVTPLEYDLYTHLSAQVAPGDVIRVDIVHQVYSYLKSGSQMIGAAAGFNFITTHLV